MAVRASCAHGQRVTSPRWPCEGLYEHGTSRGPVRQDGFAGELSSQVPCISGAVPRRRSTARSGGMRCPCCPVHSVPEDQKLRRAPSCARGPDTRVLVMSRWTAARAALCQATPRADGADEADRRGQTRARGAERMPQDTCSRETFEAPLGGMPGTTGARAGAGRPAMSSHAASRARARGDGSASLVFSDPCTCSLFL